MTLPTWLKDRLGAPIRRGVKAGRCPHCHAQILTGMDEEVCAFRATTDPAPLTPLGEALALLDARRTYELRNHNSSLALWRRDHWQIAGRSSSLHLVVADHKCGAAPLPSQFIPSQPSRKAVSNDEIPF